MQTYIHVIECKAKVCRTAVENFTFDYHHDHCYFVGQTKVKFSETRHFCDKFEGSLADVDNRLLDFINKTVRSVHQEIEEYWIVEHEKNSSFLTCTSIHGSSLKIHYSRSCESLLVPICNLATIYRDVDGCFIACDKLVAKDSQITITSTFKSTSSTKANNTMPFFNSTSSSQTSSDLQESCECEEDVTGSNKVYEIVAILLGLSFFISIVINLLLVLQIVCTFKKVNNFSSQEEKMISFTNDVLQNEWTSGDNYDRMTPGENYEEMTYGSDPPKSKQGQRRGSNVEDYSTYSETCDEAQIEHVTKREHQGEDTQSVGLNSDRPTHQTTITYATLDHRGGQFPFVNNMHHVYGLESVHSSLDSLL